MPAQQIVILSDKEPAGSDNGMAEIGRRSDVIRDLERLNTAPEVEGGDILYGPGFQIELAPGQDPVTQMLMTINDQDIAWIAIMDIAKKLEWKLLDPMTGRELRPR